MIILYCSFFHRPRAWQSNSSNVSNFRHIDHFTIDLRCSMNEHRNYQKLSLMRVLVFKLTLGFNLVDNPCWNDGAQTKKKGTRVSNKTSVLNFNRPGSPLLKGCTKHIGAKSLVLGKDLYQISMSTNARTTFIAARISNVIHVSSSISEQTDGACHVSIIFKQHKWQVLEENLNSSGEHRIHSPW